MSIEATAEALAPESAPASEPEGLDYEALFDKANDGDDDHAPERVEDEPEPAKEEAQADDSDEKAGEDDAPPAQEAPSDIPSAVRRHWGELPQEARDAITASQREMSQKLGEQGRLVQGLKPIQDVLAKAIEDLPQLADMKPADVADQVMTLARHSASFKEDPIGAMIALADQHGIKAQLAARLTGAEVGEGVQTITAMKKEIDGLKAKLTEVSSPEYLNRHLTERDLEAQVTEFASGAEHWDAVADYVPLLIPAVIANKGEGAPQKDILRAAYDLAVSQFVPEAKKATTESVADEVAPPVDPDKTEAARKAKSVNVQGAREGKPRKMTEDESLSSIYDRAQSK